jgi:surface protein
MPSIASIRSISSSTKPHFKPVFYKLESTSDPTSSTWRSSYAPKYSFVQGKGLVVRNQNIAIMYGMFRDNTNFNDPGLLHWDVSSATSMEYMFSNATAFNQPIGNWDVSSVTDMVNMFSNATVFNQDLRWWDVSSIETEPTDFGTNTSWTTKPLWGQTLNYYPLTNTATDPTHSEWRSWHAPAGGYKFKPNDGIYTLPGEPITDLGYMFHSNTTFNDPDIGSWDVSTVTTMYAMCVRAAFNQDIGDWNTSSVTNMYMVFAESAFNQDISNWDVSSVTNMNYMFSYAVFNQDIRWWDVSHIASEPTQFGGGWSSSGPTGWTNKPFWGQTLNYYPLNNSATDPTSITWRNSFAPAGGYKFKPNDGIYTLPSQPITYMNSMFKDSTTFNDPDIGSWDVSSVTDMDDMFNNAAAFNQDLTGWDVSNVTTFTDFSLNTNSSWTLKPPRQIKTYSSTQRIWQSASTIANQTQTRINKTYTLFPSNIEGISSINDILSLQLTGTTFVAPTTNQNDWSAIIKHQYGAPTTDWFTLSNSQQFSDITPYTGDLLPYLRYISFGGIIGILIQTTGSFDGSNYYHQDFDFNIEYTLNYFGESF